MSLYNMLFGVNQAAPILLAAIGISHAHVPRFRDCFIEGDKIVIHTRTGGGNREDYEEENGELQANQFYVYDEDDDFDCTYANFYYRFPDEYAAELKAIAEKSDSISPSEKWQQLLTSLQPKSGSDN
jgi:hypothetical protein